MSIKNVSLPQSSKTIVRLFLIVICIAMATVLLTMSVSAEKTYVITDGKSQTVHKSSADDPAKVLTEAGVTLDEDDTFTTVTTEGVSQITVCRTKTVHISLVGQNMDVETQRSTVGELLQELGVEREKMIVSHADSDVLCDGMKLAVSQVIAAEETNTYEVGFTVVTCQDDTMKKGAVKVLRPGTEKMVLRREKVYYVNHKEFSRATLSEEVLDKGEKRVVLIGTGKKVGKDRTEPIIKDGVIVLPDDKVLFYNKCEEFKATAYSHNDAGCNMITATGTTVHVGTVAIDPRLVKYGTKMFVVSKDGKFIYGESTAEDCGGGIKGKRIDLYYPTKEQCNAFGVRKCYVYFLQ